MARLDLDRSCDACGVKAYIFVDMPSGLPLSYCCHHGKIFIPALEALGAEVHDLSDMLDYA